MTLLASSYLHANQHHVTRLLRWIDRDKFTPHIGLSTLSRKSETVSQK